MTIAPSICRAVTRGVAATIARAGAGIPALTAVVLVLSSACSPSAELSMGASAAATAIAAPASAVSPTSEREPTDQPSSSKAGEAPVVLAATPSPPVATAQTVAGPLPTADIANQSATPAPRSNDGAVGAKRPPSPTETGPTAVPAPAAASAPEPARLTAQSARTEAPRTTQSWTEGPVEFAAGELDGLEVAEGDGLRLRLGEAGYISSGEFVSAPLEAVLPFDNGVLSWNADAPPGTKITLDLRVRASGEWSKWYGMGEWSAEGGRSLGSQVDPLGRVVVDTLKLASPAESLQYRVRMTSSSADASPLVRRISVVYADLRQGLTGPEIQAVEGLPRDLDVPRRSQLEQNPSISGLICSPTSLAMVMQYWGSQRSVIEVVEGVQDGATGIYGNWPLNTAYAAANGFQARVDRFYSMEQLEEEIAAGRPVIISIAFDPGELSGSPISSTDGHLIVVRGFDANGDVIVNDPIAANSQSVRLVYKRDQLKRVWQRNGGIVYLVSPRDGS